MNKLTILILGLTLASLGCLSTTITPVPTTEAPTATPIPDEDPAGAVFEIPAEWMDARPTRENCATVTAAQSLHIRAEPNDKAEVLGYLKAGEQVTIITFGDWWKIETATGVTGWSNADYLVGSDCE